MSKTEKMYLVILLISLNNLYSYHDIIIKYICIFLIILISLCFILKK
jgi:hypothetical protein